MHRFATTYSAATEHDIVTTKNNPDLNPVDYVRAIQEIPLHNFQICARTNKSRAVAGKPREVV